MVKIKSITSWIFPLLIFVLISILVYLMAVRLPAFLESDQKMVGAVVYSRIKPENYIRDYAITNPDFFGSYYPLYVSLLSNLTQRLGKFEHTLSLLIAVTSFLYLCSMGLLLYSVTGHRWCSIAVSIASAYPGMIGPLRDIWGPFMNIRGMRPGNLYLALSLFLFIPFFSRLTNGNVKNRSSLLFWGSLGLAFGLLTNIHQVSALGVISISSSLLLLAVLRKEINFYSLLLFIIMVFIGAVPAIIPYMQHAEGIQANEVSSNFQEFYQIAQGLAHTVFPSRLWYIAKWVRAFNFNHVMPFSWPLQRTIILSYFFSTLILSCLYWIITKRDGYKISHITYIILVLIQFVMGSLFAIRYHWISILVVVYLVNRLFIEKIFDKMDKRIIEVFVVVLLFFPLSFLLQWTWRNFEIWQLTTWATQFTREIKFIYLPAILIIARLIALWAKRRDYAMLFLAGALFFFEKSLQNDWVGLFLSWIIFIIWSIFPRNENRPWWLRELIAILVVIFIGRLLVDQNVMMSAITGLLLFFVWRMMRVFEEDQHISINRMLTNYLISIGILIVTIMLFYDIGFSLKSKTLYLICVLSLAYPLLLHILRRARFAQQYNRWITIGLWLIGILLVSNVFGRYLYYQLLEVNSNVRVFVNSILQSDNTPFLSDSQILDQELYQWVIDETPVDSLFYFSNNAFRFYAQRSITHSSKDFGQAMFIRYLLVDYYKRYHSFERAFSNKEDLLISVSSSGADYLIANKSKQKEMIAYVQELPWLLLFENAQFMVYRINE